MPKGLRLVGHKGADLIAPGNTVESFRAAVEAEVDTIEIDVLWTQAGHPRLATKERTPLVVAHDWHDAERRTPLTLEQGLDAFLAAPLDQVEIDLDIKLPGREEEIVAALRERDLLGRAMISTMELSTLARIRGLEPGLRRGWTYPKVTKDWASKRWARAPMLAALVAMRRRLPGIAARALPEMGVDSMWVYHQIVTRRLAQVTRAAGIELIAWTVDDLPRMRELAAAGVTGLCSNDPRLFATLGEPIGD
ncbi:MAG TPA: glycerophosphodiester phosphodiesterase [Solirubrobacterales bacterium]|nr:glycerophosphodiester phosphodiesterase [Solirubrobacterales bacterium]